MLSPEHCLSRAERLRISLLTTRDRTAARRLRTFVEKYRILADRAITTKRDHLLVATAK
jgi:hypothetical protein